MRQLLILIFLPFFTTGQTIDEIHTADVNDLSSYNSADLSTITIHGAELDLETESFSNDKYFAFDGVDAYMSYDTESNDREIEDDFTIAFWFRAHD